MTICHMTVTDQRMLPRVVRECASAHRAGYRTYIVAPGDSFEQDETIYIGVERPKNRKDRMLYTSKQLFWAAIQVNADIYQLHDPGLLPYGMKLKRLGKKVVFDSHEDTLHQIADKTWIPRFLRPMMSAAYGIYARGVFSKCDALLSVTPHIVEGLQRVNKNTLMITNFPILIGTTSSDKENVFTICFTGGVSRQWCHKEILEAISQIDQVHYTLCGTVDSGYLDELKVMQGWDKVNYLGMVSHEDALRVQGRSHVGMTLLKPSFNTGHTIGTLGNTKIFEYMMASIPVICTDFVLWKEIIDKWHCGICVNPDDLNAVVQAIVYLRDHPNEARQMGQNGRYAVECEYNWGTQEQKLLKMYAEIGGQRA